MVGRRTMVVDPKKNVVVDAEMSVRVVYHLSLSLRIFLGLGRAYLPGHLVTIAPT
jgi:hypothetical protein